MRGRSAATWLLFGLTLGVACAPPPQPEMQDPSKQCPGWLDLRFPATKAPMQTIRVHLNVGLVPSWNEIDAVELIGTP
ncbi:MAG: hypothetical protein COZ06_32875 [Armatimonadetes bacterium CG_4_10_14_3_um_filter_66_18]|nr:hypothetical protein [Armatimonadota bacterium]OIO95608.1 MAG: hypothetical protein AUJ96_26445 [Armatimonadetes bacterium CG2_30_66_41]PIX49754.1 MAG: hypothetical protein COZ57_02365 [Armatimonadetes bacterium CG_4_8_14_3_um_filter_66_20]PIY37488.1 MAG: hypothetical protein COZ06_32875 [Armatimonadetes bacterium CG_4_10_14_3_um_filter_66_18]PIZ44676.1 MAG: hypothetical protein COY42_13490 [Armatimonadetes bacterium CG_4_10_14_0_8_um_filter_66_14]PJB60533.1 MAG: hypothetical protein CO096_